MFPSCDTPIHISLTAVASPSLTRYSLWYGGCITCTLPLTHFLFPETCPYALVLFRPIKYLSSFPYQADVQPDELYISTRRPETLATLQSRGAHCGFDNVKVHYTDVECALIYFLVHVKVSIFSQMTV